MLDMLVMGPAQAAIAWLEGGLGEIVLNAA
jgi:hypothetical protein